MMELKDQVCSLELANRLKELGVKQSSLFNWVWVENYSAPHVVYFENENIHRDYPLSEILCSAFTVAELGNLLPIFLMPDTPSKDYCFFSINKYMEGWMLSYSIKDSLPPLIVVIEANEADARAKMLIHLIENKLIKIE